MQEQNLCSGMKNETVLVNSGSYLRTSPVLTSAIADRWLCAGHPITRLKCRAFLLSSLHVKMLMIKFNL